MVNVAPQVETGPANGTGDIADMAMVWLHPTVLSQSFIVGTSKDTSVGGVHTFDLAGNEVDFIQIGACNSIDIRYNFPLGGETVDLIAVSNRTLNRVHFLTIDPATGELSVLGTHTVDTSLIYGFCLAHDRVTDTFYSIPNFEGGMVEQWELDGTSGSIVATKVRSFDVGSQPEGAVADDFQQYLFIGEEDVGLWRYGLDPTSGSSRISVDNVSGNLSADVEGLALYYESTGNQGYLIASSQGDSTFQLYERESPHAHVGEITIVAGNGIDAVTLTDGISVCNRNLGSPFASGVFIAHDGGESPSNYKLVSWNDIATGLSLRSPDTTFDPRGGQSPETVIWGEWSAPVTTTDPGGVAWGEYSDPVDAIQVVGQSSDTLDRTISATADQGGIYDIGGDDEFYAGIFDNGGIWLGRDGNNPMGGWWRFPNITVPPGSTITAANIDFVNVHLETAGTLQLVIAGVDEDDHVAPTNASEWTTDHGLHTTETVPWSFVAAASGDRPTPDIAAIIQEIIDREGWQSGNDVGIHIDDNGSPNAVQVVGTNPTLHIEYTEPAGGATIESQSETEQTSEVTQAHRAIVRVEGESVQTPDNELSVQELLRLTGESVQTPDEELSVQSLLRTFGDAEQVSDAQQSIRDLVRSFSESLETSLDDLILRGVIREVLESSSLSEAEERYRGLFKIQAEGSEPTETNLSFRGIFRALDETLATSEATLRFLVLVRQISETVDLSDDDLRYLALLRTDADSVSVTEEALPILSLLRFVSETASLSDVELAFVVAQGVQIIKVQSESAEASEAQITNKGIVTLHSEGLQIPDEISRVLAIKRVEMELESIAGDVEFIRTLIRVYGESEELDDGVVRTMALVRVDDEELEIEELARASAELSLTRITYKSKVADNKGSSSVALGHKGRLQ